MAVHVEEMTSEVAVFEGELPLSDKQTEALVAKVMAKLAEKRKTGAQEREATRLRTGATPQLEVD
jgi:hypothetical protein